MDAYRIGVTIAMSSNAASVLGVIGKDLLGLSSAAKALESQLGLVKIAAVGAMAALAGVGVLKGMWSLVDAGKELVQQQALMKTAGMSPLEVARATQEAWRIAGSVGTSSVAEVAKSIKELRMVFGETAEAIDHAEKVTKGKAIIDNVLGHGKGDQVFDMAKAAELKGVSMDPAKFDQMLDAFVKVANASGGKVLFSDFLSTFKYGRAATAGWDERFIGGILPTLIQEFKTSGGAGGAGGPGNALMSAYQAVVGGVMTNKAAEEFAALKLVDPKKIIRTTTGSIKGIRPGGIAGSDMFQADPFQWVQDYLLPALIKKGITSPEGQREAVAHLFTNRTAQQVMSMFVTQQGRFLKDEELIHGAKGMESYEIMSRESPTMKMEKFTKAWENLMTALGVPLVDSAMKIIDKFTAVMVDIGQWAAHHPQLVGNIEKIAAAIGIGLAVGGTITLVGAVIALAGPVGVAVAGITALVAAIAALNDYLPKSLQFNPKADRTGSVFSRDWLSPLQHQKGPIEVHVTNGRDLTDSLTSHLDRSANRPSSGITGPDIRSTFGGGAAYAQ